MTQPILSTLVWHQVLQHMADPVRALREMRRVAKPGGIVACRESASMTWYPPSEGIDAWWALSNRVSHARGCNPHSGSYIHAWTEKAGFEKTEIAKSAGTWCFSSPEERAYWGGSMAESSGFVNVAVEEGFATREEIEKTVEGWKRFVEDESGWYAVLHGEIVCTKQNHRSNVNHHHIMSLSVKSAMSTEFLTPGR